MARSIRLTFRNSMLASAALICSAPALAQDAEQGSEDPGEHDSEIVINGAVLYSDQVNALRSPTPIIDVPQSLSIVTQEDITARGFTSIGQIVDYTPGVNNSQGEGHRDSIVFRGVRSTADFFIDGVRDDVQYYRALYNLEQVEILRGPNALLFGRGGTGGILNRVTKRGVIGETFTAGQAAIDTYGEFGLQFDTNIEAGDTAAIRVNGLYENLNNQRDFYDGERIGLNPTVRFELSPATIVDLSYEYANHERFIDRGIPTGADGRPVEELSDVVFGDPENNFLDLEAHLLRATVQHEFAENLKGNFTAFYGNYDKVYSNFFVNSYDPTTNIAELDGYIDTTERENFILSGNLIGGFETGTIGHTIVFGGEYIGTSSNQNRFNTFFDTSAADVAAAVAGARTDRADFLAVRPINLLGNVGVLADGRTTINDFTVDLNDDTRADVDVFSIYIQDEIKLTEWLRVVVGGRFDSFDIEVFNVPANDLRSRKDEEFTPRGGIILKPQENVSIYASYSESFLPRSGEQFANINGDNDALAPDTFTNLEAGLKWDFQPGLSLTAAVFQIEQRSPQPSDDDPSTLDIIDSKIEGVELQLNGQITDFWTVSAGYSYLDGEQVDINGPTGLRPRELPEHTFSLWNSFEVTERFGLGAGFTYQDESFINNGNSATLPSYTRFDASAYYDVSADWRVQVNVENITDELYFPNSHSTNQVTVGKPLNARFTVIGQF